MMSLFDEIFSRAANVVLVSLRAKTIGTSENSQTKRSFSYFVPSHARSSIEIDSFKVWLDLLSQRAVLGEGNRSTPNKTISTPNKELSAPNKGS